MFQTAAAFGAGLLVQNSAITTCSQWPSCSASVKSDVDFKINVRVHAASVPLLRDQGRVVRFRVSLLVSFAGSEKETEVADFCESANGAACDSGELALKGESQNPATDSTSGDCRQVPANVWANWRFGDSLAFCARARDLLGPAMRLRLRMQSDVCLGPLRVQLPHSQQDLGEVAVDLRRRVLPAAAVVSKASTTAPCAGCALQLPSEWETPAYAFPLVVPCDPCAGAAASEPAFVVVSFTINNDPLAILRTARCMQMPFSQRVVDRFTSCVEVPAGPLFCRVPSDRGSRITLDPSGPDDEISDFLGGDQTATGVPPLRVV